MCVSVHIFQKAFGPITFRHMIEVKPNRNNSLPLIRPFHMQNDSFQVPILSSKNAPTCAGVRPSSPYYRVRTSALTPDGGLINGVGSLSQGGHLKAGQMFQTYNAMLCVVKPRQIVTQLNYI